MKYIVCVKQVPNTSGKVAVKEDGTMDRSKMATIINPDDLNAVEAALALRDRNPDAKVIVVSMGPPPAMGMLHELLAMGADEAVLVSGREFGGSDTFATSQILAGAIAHIGLEKDDIVFWACVYKCICHITSAPEELVHKAKEWLYAHGMTEQIFPQYQ